MQRDDDFHTDDFFEVRHLICAHNESLFLRRLAKQHLGRVSASAGHTWDSFFWGSRLLVEKAGIAKLYKIAQNVEGEITSDALAWRLWKKKYFKSH